MSPSRALAVPGRKVVVTAIVSSSRRAAATVVRSASANGSTKPSL
jgi:hypothetical protein